MKKIISILLALVLPLVVFAQSVEQKSAENYAKIAPKLKELAQKGTPTNELIIAAALMRVGEPYVAGTLETVPEKLIVNIGETDCIIFVESCLAMALNAQKGATDYESLCETIQKLRYRDGIVDGYSSRLHYTSEWIMQGEEMGIFKEITKELSGNNLSGQKFSYMSSHSDSYKQLKDSPAEIETIRKAEEKLNEFDYYLIKREDIPNVLDKLKDGDILGLNTSIEGLDIAHVGYIYHVDGKVHFIHASYGAKKVVIETKTLVEYANNSKKCDGIRIIRVN